MTYSTPIYDRTLSDVIARNSKAYLNLVDWQRIDNNTQEVVSLIFTVFGASVSQAVVTTMTTASTPPTDDVNDLAGNIEAMRLWVVTNYPASPAATDPDFTEVKDDYIAGEAQNYVIINQWEQVIDIAYQWVDKYPGERLLESGFVRLLEDGTPRILG